uniref:Epiplakin 1 n=1 Tax=Oncorhynchus kisutch TaxID=8019 RepID=A0A8C7MUM4_ONCKI
EAWHSIGPVGGPGKTTTQDVMLMETVKEYLEGKGGISGVAMLSSNQRMSIYQAMKQGILMPGTALVLLEAQAATGFMIDPVQNKKFSVDEAIKNKVVGPDYHAKLLSAERAVTGYKDPYTSETISLFQALSKDLIVKEHGIRLLEAQIATGGIIDPINSHRLPLMGRCVIDPATGLCLLPLMEQVSVTLKRTNVVFEGIRETVTAKQLVEADIISENILEELNKGKKTVKEVTEDETVQMYLQGKVSIAGVLLPDSQIMTIYQARQKGKLMPGTALILLEAQAATGFIIDPIANRKFSVDEAVKANIVGPDLHGKLRSAEKAVTGYKDPYTGKTISLFQAMQKDLILQDHGIRLLEAQIATGGIIDPLNSHRIPVHVAYKRGYFNEEMNQILDDPSDDTKGFFDPNTHENLTYLKLMARCVTDPSTGLCLLPLKGKSNRVNIQDHIKETFQATNVTVKYGRFSCKHVTLWDLINSEYLCEDKRQELFKLYKSRMITIKEIIVIILEIIECKEIKWQAGLNFEGLRGNVSVVDLLRLEIVDEKTYKSLIEGKLTNKDILKIDTVRTYLKGNSCVAGVILQPSSQKLSIYEAKKKGILTPGTALSLLEAQAATGFIIDPLHNQKLTVDHALKEKIIGPELYEKLLSAEKAVTGYTDPYTDKKISLFQAMKKDLILQQHGIRLLEAQIATGGIIDPLKCLHLPLEVAYRKGYFDVELNQILTDPSDDTKGFFDPRTQANLTYMEMMEQCIKDPETGLFLLPLMDKTKTQDETEKIDSDAEIKQEFEKTTVSISVGRYSGKTVSLWYLIHSGYFTDDQRLQFLEKYRTKKITIQVIITLVISTITKLEENKTLKTTIGLRKPVSAKQLLKSSIIDANTFRSLEEGKVTLEQVTKLESVKQYLRGTGSVAGVQILPSKKVMSIYEAKTQGLLTPGTALKLLEAQAATGFVIDPIKNKYLSVDEAARERLIGLEIHEKLLSAERAVTGYVDPYTDDTISLFEAMKKDLIEKGHGIHLLEAQIATGGIIDPVNSYRIPSHVAKKNGYLDEETSEVMSNPNDDTKGFFDPSTKENLTYLQLRERCEKDSHTGLLLLPLHVEAGGDFHTDEQTEQEFKDKIVVINAGIFEDKQVSMWDVLISEYISKLKREQLLKQYKTRSLTMKEIIEIVIIIIQEVTSKKIKFKGLRKQVSASELYESQIISKELFTQIIHGEVTEETVGEMESIQKYLGATNSVAGVRIESTKEIMSIYEAKSKGLLTPGTSLVLLEAQAATGFVIDPVKNKKLSVEEAAAQGVVGNEWKNKLLSAERAVTGYKDPYTGNTISLFQALKKDLIVKDHGIRLLEAQIATGGIIDPVYSHRVPVEVAYQRGYFDEEMNQILDDPDDDTKGFFDPNTQENLTYLQLVERCVTDPDTGLSLLVIVKKGEFYFFIDEQTKNILKAMTTTKAGGKFQGQKVSLWDLLYSKYITEERRRELVQQYKSGAITIERFMEIILAKTSFHGIRKNVTAGELLASKIIDKKLYEDLNTGKVTVNQVSEMDSVHKYLEGTNSIAGVYVQSTKQTMSIYEAKSKGLLTPGTSLVLLEAQAATGFVIDPVKNKKLSVEEAAAQGVVGNEWKNKLLSAERAVTGYKDPYTGNTISLFQALKKDLIVKDHGIRLLEAQIATGGIIDPVYSHRVPVEVAYQRGYFDEEMNQILDDPDDDTKGFFDPNTQENLTYLQLVERCVTDPDTGLSLLVINILKAMTTTKAGGKFQGQKVSLWDLLYSKYITEERRRELVQQYKSGSEKTTITTTTTETSFHGIRKNVTAGELLASKIIDKKLYEDLNTGKVTVNQVSEMDSVHKYLEGTNSIAGVYVQSTKQTMSIYEAKSKGLLTPGTSLVLLEAQAATGFVIDPVKNKKLSVEEAAAQGVVGNEWKNKLLSAERAVTGYKDPYTGNTISLFQALKKDLIVKDHGIRLLEAQIATGGIIDPVYSHRVPVEVAYQRGYFDEEMNQILDDPDDDTKGFFDPNTQENLTYLQLVERCVTDPDTGLSLLVIVKKGEFYFFIDEQTKNILKAMTTTKAGGKFQGQKVSLWDLLYSKYITEERRRELVQQYKSGAITIEQTSFHGIRKNVTAGELLASKIIDKKLYEDLNTGKVTVNQVSEMDSVHKYLEGTNSIAGVYVQSTKQTMSIYEAKSKGLLTPGTSLVLLEAQAATGFVIDPVKNKKLSVEEAAAQGVVGNEWKNKLLSAERAVTGYKDPYTGNTISLFQALKKDLIVKDHGIRLLEAQIATGGIIDPVYSHRVPVEVAYQRGYFDEEMNQILVDPDDDTKGFFDPNTQENLTYLQLVERCVTDPDTGLSLLVIVKKGEFYFFIDEQTKNILKAMTTTKAGGKFQGQKVSLWDLLYSKYITEERRRELVQQYKSGAITIELTVNQVSEMDSVHKYLEGTNSIAGVYVQSTKQTMSIYEAKSKGLLTPGTSLVLLEAQAATGFVIDPRCVTDPDTGLSLLVIVKKGEFYFFIDEQTKNILKAMTTTKAGGKFQGQKVSLWDLLYSKYITEERRRELVQQYKSGAITIERFMEIILAKTSFHGIRKNVTAGELLASKIIDKKLYEDLNTGKVTVNQVSEMDSVHKYLEGTNSIAGVYVQSTKQTMSIYEAKSKGLLTPGTSLVLLEAQAATGFVIDPVKNKKLSVEEAAAQGVVGNEWKNKLLSAERAVTGYKDPYTGNTISLFQALKKDLIVKDHGIRLLEAQIATGGIIDPVYSHRVPVEVAYQRGYFDEEMNQILDDPDDDTKGFFDPNTQENLTYLQLVERCVTDPDTGLSLLVIVKKGEFYFFIDEQTKNILKAMTTTKAGGKFQGQKVSLWDLLYSKYITEERRRELVQQYKSGAITIERFMEIILATSIQQKTTTTITTTSSVSTCTPPPDTNEMDSVHKYLEGTNSIAGVYVQSTKQTMSIYEAKSKGLLTPGTSLVLLEAQAATGFVIDPRCVTDPDTGLSLLVIVKKGEFYFFIDEQTKNILKAMTTTKAGGKFQGQKVSLWDLLYSKYITEERRRELVQQYKSGAISIERFMEIILAKTSFHGIRKNVTAGELLASKIIDKKLYEDLNTGKVTVNQVSEMDSVHKYLEGTNSIAGVYVQSTKQTMSIYEAKSKGLLTPGTSLVLLEAQAATGFVIDPVKNKKLSVEEAAAQGVVGNEWKNKLLSAERAVTGYKDPYTGNTISLFQALKKDLIVKDHGIRLLEAQIATGGIIDPVYSHRVPVEVAYQRGYFDEEMNQILDDPDDDTKGFFDPNTQENLTYLQLVERCVTDPDTGLSLLVIVKKGEFYFFIDEQTKNILKAMTTTKAGGKFQGQKVSLWDLLYSKYITEERRRELVQQYKSGAITIERFMEIILATITVNQVSEMDSVHKYLEGTNSIAGVYVQSTKQTMSIYEAKSKGLLTPGTSLVLLEAQAATGFVIDPVKNKKLSVEEAAAQGQTKNILKAMTTTKAGGKFQGQKVSLWDLLYSKYITEERRRELVQQYKSGAITIERFMEIILAKTSFHGIRKNVTAGELLASKIIDKKLYEDLNTGKVTVNQVSEMDSVHKYLEGTNSIAGVYVQSTKQTMSIYEAKSKGLLTPGTSLVLLEAQAATGFVIDPVKNKKLSVEEAAAQGVVGNEWKNKLLSAERAVTGYKDPYTGNTISLFQALKKDLIVKDHGIRLLEAQIATGGIIDPVYSHRVPVEVAYQRGYFDEEMNQILDDPDDDTKGFFDPNTQENLTYLQLVERCVTDPDTGLSLLVIVKKGEFYFFIDEQTKNILKAMTTTKAGGKFQGQKVSLWDLLYSKYITEERRRELVQQYKSGAITIELTVNQVSEMDSVHKYLEGTNSIAGVYVQSTKQTMSIYEAKSKGLLTPGTSLVLLEAQAATGFVIDPVKNKKLSVEEAAAQGQTKNILKAMTTTKAGGKFQGQKVSLWDLLYSKYITEERRRELVQQYKSGAITIERFMEIILAKTSFHGIRKNVTAGELLASKIIDKKLYEDLNTGKVTVNQVSEMDSVHKYLEGTNSIAGVYVQSTKQTMSIYEAKSKGLLTPGTSLVLLEAQAATGFVIDPVKNKKLSVEEAAAQGVVGNEWKNKLLSAERAVTGYKDPYTGNTISLFQALKKDLIVKDHGIRLLEAQIATGGIIDPVYSHRVPVEVAYQRGYFDEEMNQILDDPDDDTKGFFDPNTQENLTYLQLVERCVTDPDTGLSLLVIVKKGEFYFFIDEQTKNILKAMTTTKAGGKFQGQKVSLWDLLYSKYITEERRRELVQQYKSGAITIERFMEIILASIQQKTTTTITSTSSVSTCTPPPDTNEMDSVHKYLEGTNSIAGVYVQSTKQTMSIYEAKSKGLLTPGTSLVLLEAQAATGFVIDPRCVTDPDTGLSLLVIVKKGEFYFFIDEQTKNILKAMTTTKAGGKFQGQKVSLWDLLYSKYITEERRRELVQQYKSGAITIESIMEIILAKTSFHGIRKNVTAGELLASKIIDKKLYEDLNTGKVTVNQVSEMDSVHKYLEGTNSIAGVYVQSTKQTMSIYEAKSKGLLTPGTSLVLLEAQAATGFVIDPVKNKKLSVEEAAAQGVIGNEWKNKLLSAERAVTGYKDPYTGNTISLFQALKKDLIVKDHGIRLLEAQIATGGIIDPVYSHRVPVEVAYQRGYLDEEMNHILNDPDDDTKGFFDPNTQENLTYLQLLERCVRDPDSGLSFLSLNK